MSLVIDDDIEKDALFNAILVNNKRISEKHAEPAKVFCENFRMGGRGRGPTTIIFNVHPRLRADFLNRPIYLDWQRLFLRDYYNITQCFRCHEYGHRSENCRLPCEREICGRQGHSYRECSNATICWINYLNHNKHTQGRSPAINTDHHTRSDDCPAKIIIIQVIKNKINYDDQQ